MSSYHGSQILDDNNMAEIKQRQKDGNKKGKNNPIDSDQQNNFFLYFSQLSLYDCDMKPPNFALFALLSSENFATMAT